MNCPKCSAKLLNGCCLKCGYMTNGNQIKNEYQNEKFGLERIYNKNFDKMYRNENSIFPFLLGGIYLSYKGYLLFGILLNIIEFIFYVVANKILSIIPIVMFVSGPLMFLIILMTRLVIAATVNTVCLYFDDKKIRRLLKKYPKNYIKYILKHGNYLYKALLNIIFSIMLYLCFFNG